VQLNGRDHSTVGLCISKDRAAIAFVQKFGKKNLDNHYLSGREGWLAPAPLNGQIA